MAEKDPLDVLFVTGEINRQLLRDALVNLVRLDAHGSIFPLQQFYDLNNKGKVATILLARKALSLKTNTPEEMTPLEIVRASGIPEGSVRPTLRLLVAEGVTDDREGKYRIKPAALTRLIVELRAAAQQSQTTTPAIATQQRKAGVGAIIEELAQNSFFDENKSAREAFEAIRQQRPGSKYNAVYKILLDFVHRGQLMREVRNGEWTYKRKTV